MVILDITSQSSCRPSELVQNFLLTAREQLSGFQIADAYLAQLEINPVASRKELRQTAVPKFPLCGGACVFMCFACGH